MSFFEDLFGGGDQTITTRNEIDPEDKARKGTIWDRAITVADQPFTPYPYPRVAPMSPGQVQAGNYLNENLGSWRGPLGAAGAAAGSAMRFDDPSVPVRQQAMPGMINAPMGPLRGYSAPPGIDVRSMPGFAELMKFTGGGAGGGTWGAEAQKKYLNPYRGAQMDEIARQAQIATRNAGLRGAAMKSFGGSSTAIENAAIQEAAMRQRGLTEAQSWENAFGMYAKDRELGQRDDATALQAATEGARLGLSAEQSNQAATMKALSDSLAAVTGMDRVNAENMIRAMLANQQTETAVGKTNLEAGMSADRTNLDAGFKNRAVNLDVAKVFQNLAATHGEQVAREFASLFGYGGTERSIGQQQLDAMFEEFMRAENEPTKDLNTLISAFRALPQETTQVRTGPGENTGANVLSTMLMLAGLGKNFGLWGGATPKG